MCRRSSCRRPAATHTSSSNSPHGCNTFAVGCRVLRHPATDPFPSLEKELTMAIEKTLYTAHATSTGGRAGTSRTPDGTLELTLSTPKEMGGAGGPGTNPEQLFAAGYSACFIGAMKA